jgi:hypothetical protein
VTGLLVACAIALSIVTFSFGYALREYHQDRAEQARRDEQQTNEKETQ